MFLLLVKTRYVAMTCLVTYFRRNGTRSFQRVGFLASSVHGDDLMRPGGCEGRQISRDMLVGGISDRSIQAVGGEEIERRVVRLQLRMTRRQQLGSIFIYRHFVIQAAFEFGAHAG